MSLSVIEAAARTPTAVALIIDGQAISFADLAARVRERQQELAGASHGLARAIVCRPVLASLLELYACMESHLPVALLSPKLSPEREGALRTAIASFRPTDGALAIVFTSGSGGEPKGVELSRRAFEAAANASAARLGWREDDRWLLGLSFAHIGGLSIITRCLAARRPAVVVSANRFSASEVAHALQRDRATLLSLVPTQLHQFLELAPAWKPPEHLRAVLLGGAAADPALVKTGRARGWPLLLTYGMTETCSQIATQPPTESEDETSAPPLPGFELRIVDDGIQVRSPTLLTTYQPIGVHPDPRTADGWLVTEDLGRIDTRGRLEVLGRRDDVIVTGGEKVMPLEVERVLASSAGIRAVSVFGIADAVWGQLVAAAIVLDAQALDLRGLRETIRSRLSSFQRPRRLAILDELPLSPSGKVDRRALARLSPERLTALEFS